MPYYPGDIILKIDTRSTADTIQTRHHVMLVIKVEQKGMPVVAHMTTSTGMLIIETLERGTDLEILHFNFDVVTQSIITRAAELAYFSRQYSIDEDIIGKHLKAVTQYRPSNSFEAPKKLAQLQAAFNENAVNRFVEYPAKKIIMSCHEFVISLIHNACKQSGADIPQALRIPPSLAWADRLHYAAKDDDSVTKYFQTFRPQTIEEKEIPQAALKKSKEKKSDGWLPNLFGCFKTPTEASPQTKTSYSP